MKKIKWMSEKELISKFDLDKDFFKKPIKSKIDSDFVKKLREFEEKNNFKSSIK